MDVSDPIETTADALIPLHRDWCGWRTAQARLSDLQDVHWLQPVGAPRLILHAYIDREKIIGSDFVTEDEAPSGERLLVCVLRSQTPPAAYAALVSLAEGAREPQAPPARAAG